jgi:hypothetical protein
MYFVVIYVQNLGHMVLFVMAAIVGMAYLGCVLLGKSSLEGAEA